MTQRYEPSSVFLNAIRAGDVPLSGSEFGEANLRLLMTMTQDVDSTNRDWATFLLAQEEVDTNEVRDALLLAARDGDPFVRGEAILGLARRDRELALPLVQEALSSETVVAQIFEAAALVAHPSLVERLRDFTDPSDHAWLDRVTVEALEACERGVPAY